MAITPRGTEEALGHELVNQLLEYFIPEGYATVFDGGESPHEEGPWLRVYKPGTYHWTAFAIDYEMFEYLKQRGAKEERP